jgi:hypothetical protein
LVKDFKELSNHRVYDNLQVLIEEALLCQVLSQDEEEFFRRLSSGALPKVPATVIFGGTHT